VIVASRDEAACIDVAERIERDHRTEAHGFACNMADVATVDAIAEFATTTFGGVDVLVNNTGGPPFGPVSEVNSESWRESFESMFVSVTRLTGHLLPGMRERGWGRILLVTSTGVVEPIPTLGISNSLRIALTNWAKTLSFEIAADGVTINSLMPGRIDTDRIEQLYKMIASKQDKDVDAVREEDVGQIPMGRVGTVAEFGAMAAFLAGEQAGYITGTATAIDGGLTQRAV
ncbi:MAG TPA: 3-oxoacyl-ACP reductase, partial [Rhodospirillaceae bacterium]|nr:3-oxoacyl-ACP reductase [Rhodospirillaceae bacterium]